jgi:hypothetical protein
VLISSGGRFNGDDLKLVSGGDAMTSASSSRKTRFVSAMAGLALWTLPAVPSAAQTIEDLPRIGPEIRASRLAYETAKEEERNFVARIEAVETRAEAARRSYLFSLVEYNRRTEELGQAVIDAQKAVETTSAREVEADRLYQQLRPARGERVSERASEAQKTRDAAREARRQAEGRLEAARAALFKFEPLEAGTFYLKWRAADLAAQRMSRTLGYFEDQVAKAFEAYTTLVLRHPPPHLAAVTMDAGGDVFYTGVWSPDPDADAEGGADDPEYEALLDGAIARIESEIAEAEKILETLSRARGDLIGYQQSSNFRLVFLAKYVALTERNEVIAPALLELAAAVTGAINAGTVVEGLDGVLELAKKNSKITALSQTSLGGANDAFGKQWAAILLDHWSFDFIGWTSDFVGITGDLPIATGNAKDVIIGDTIETLLAAGADAITTQSSLQTLKSLPGLRNFVSKLGSEAKNFALVTGMKAVIASITEATSEGVMRDFNQELVTAVWFAGQYDLALRAGRGVEEMRARLKARLAYLRYMKEAGEQPLALSVARNGAPSFLGDLTIAMRFSQPLDRAPQVLLDETPMTVTGGAGNATGWRATLGGGRGVGIDTNGDGYLQLSVSPGPGATPWPSLDSNPATPVKLDLGQLLWLSREDGPDLNHRFRLGIEGLWKDQWGTVVEIRARGETDLVNTDSAQGTLYEAAMIEAGRHWADHGYTPGNLLFSFRANPSTLLISDGSFRYRYPQATGATCAPGSRDLRARMQYLASNDTISASFNVPWISDRETCAISDNLLRYFEYSRLDPSVEAELRSKFAPDGG